MKIPISRAFAFASLAFSLVLVQSCITFQPLSDSELSAKAAAVLTGESHIEPLELKLDTDYVDERISLVQAISRTYALPNGTTGTESAVDAPLGLSFGNGLFLDSAGNLVVRLDRLAGVSNTFQGTMEIYSGSDSPIPADKIAPEMKAVYSGNQVTVSKSILFSEENYSVDLNSNDPEALHFRMLFLKDGSVKIGATWDLGLFTGVTWEKTTEGYKRSGLGTLLGMIPFLKVVEYKLGANSVSDSNRNLLVENNGKYLRVTYSDPARFLFRIDESFRIYQTETQIGILYETTGKLMVFHKTKEGLHWDNQSLLIVGTQP